MGVTDWIAVDWGTSNLRAWGIGPDGATTFAVSSDRGMARLTSSEYPGVLSALVGDHLGDRGLHDVLICGMAGARQGWMEAPYFDVPASLGGLALGAVAPDAGERFRVRILPGVCQKTAGDEDVMRGEETQILGLCAENPGLSGLVCLPGTHSKWVEVSADRIEHFTTAMTGEVFDLLGTHSVLRHSLGGATPGPEHDDGFDAGIAVGLDRPHALLSEIFTVRAGGLLSSRQPSWSRGYLSGLLIGSEIGGFARRMGNGLVRLVGNAGLCGLYSRALSRIGVESSVTDATEATLGGLKAARAGL